MNIKTTINLSVHSKTLLHTAKHKTDHSISRLVILLVRRFAKEHFTRIRKSMPVQYQERKPKKTWRKQHITIQENDYECCLDLRKFYKCSVSLIVSLAVDLYLDEIIDSLTAKEDNSGDNYTPQQYSMDNGTHKGINFWIVFWGKPKGAIKIHY